MRARTIGLGAAALVALGTATLAPGSTRAAMNDNWSRSSAAATSCRKSSTVSTHTA